MTFPFHRVVEYDGKTFCVNLVSSNNVNVGDQWLSGSCLDTKLVFDAHTTVTWDGQVWSA